MIGKIQFSGETNSVEFYHTQYVFIYRIIVSIVSHWGCEITCYVLSQTACNITYDTMKKVSEFVVKLPRDF